MCLNMTIFSLADESRINNKLKDKMLTTSMVTRFLFLFTHTGKTIRMFLMAGEVGKDAPTKILFAISPKILFHTGNI